MMKDNNPSLLPDPFTELVDKANLSRAQMMFHLGQNVRPEVPLYNMALSFTLHGEIDAKRFADAFTNCVNESDSLRTVFDITQEIPKQRVLPKWVGTVEQIDLSQHDDSEKVLQSWQKVRCQERLDPTKQLFDSVLIKMGTSRFVWFLNIHHLITDAWSSALVYERVAAWYHDPVTVGSAGEPPQFAKFLKQELANRTQSSKSDITKFAEKFGNPDLTAPSLYGAVRRATTTTTARVTRVLDREMVNRLRETATQSEWRGLTTHFSIFNLLAAVLFAWSHRVSNQDKLGIGTPIHNRSNRELKKTIGPFIEMVPLMVEISDDETFSSLISKTKFAATELFQEARPGISQPDLLRGINVVLNYITAGMGSFGDIPMTCEWVHCGHGDAGHHLRLQVHDFDKTGSLKLLFDFNTEVFDPQLREAAADQFLNLLSHCLNNPHSLILDAPMLDESESAQLLNQINPQPPGPQKENSVLELFERCVERKPRHTAVRCGETRVSYLELNQQSSQVADWLRRRDIGEGDRVGVWMGRSHRTIISILGILKSGAAYVPLDRASPTSRLSYQIQNAAVRLVIVDSANQGLPQVETVEMNEALQEGNAGNAAPSVTPQQPAYVIYTSGSTGNPKGVQISHAALVNYITWAANQYVQDDRGNFPFFTPLSFDLTVTSLFVPLTTGNTVVVFDGVRSRDGFSILDVINDSDVDIIKLTPAHLELLAGVPPVETGVHTLVLGGEDLKRKAALSALAVFGDSVRIFNEYGPTEATVGCMTHLFDPKTDLDVSVPIGVPACGSKIYILNQNQRLAPQGVVGEIGIAGPCLADGYLNPPQSGPQKFVDDPYCTGERLYLTGDLARLDSRGLVEYIGRSDSQIKFRGHRIEIDEIECALLGHSHIRSVAVKLLDPAQNSVEQLFYCKTCGLPSNYPGASYDSNGECHLCRGFDSYRRKVADYFRDRGDLKKLLGDSKIPRSYDCMMLLSGGKDSTFALGQLVDMGLNVYAFTLDNGYLSEQAMGNISRVVASLKVDHVFAKTEAMEKIFAASLKTHSNVCNGCFKTVYTLAMKKAKAMGIPYIVTGLSRGQFFETRFTEELFKDENLDPDRIDQLVLEARKSYHRTKDEVYQLLDGSCFDGDKIFEDVSYVDFYRYFDVGLEEMYAYLNSRLPWVRPQDTGRSTNCRINDVGIYVHQRERGFHNYAFPYSWDVRMGHKKRDAALAELDDDINETEVNEILDTLKQSASWQPRSRTESTKLVAYFVADQPVTNDELRRYLGQRLPQYSIPSHFVSMESLPLTPNGKTNRSALPEPGDVTTNQGTPFREAQSPIEKTLANIWSEVLRSERVGIDDNFFDLGGDSILAVRIVSRAKHSGIELSPSALFQHQTIKALSAIAGTLNPSTENSMKAKPSRDSFSSISSKQRNQLADALRKRR